MNKCEHDVIHNLQQKKNPVFYREENIEAIMNIGNFRNNQEDSLLYSHSLNNVELLLVSDGMGGLCCGEKASNIVAKTGYYWFQEINNHEFNSIKLLKDSIKMYASYVDDKIRQEYGNAGATLIMALVLNDSVLVANIGDSRAYSIFHDKLVQVTVDQSITQKLYDDGVIMNKDYIRFHRKNNLILSKLGGVKKNYSIDFYEIDKIAVDQLLLMTDGISDCVSNERMQSIILHNKDFCESIMTEAMTVDSFLESCSDDYYSVIKAGKDNASILCRRKKNGKN